MPEIGVLPSGRHITIHRCSNGRSVECKKCGGDVVVFTYRHVRATRFREPYYEALCSLCRPFKKLAEVEAEKGELHDE